MSDSPIQHVTDTAYWVAWYRAVETARPDALFRDPFAAKLAGEHGRKIAEAMPTGQVTAWNIVMRTVIIDDLVQKAVADGVDTVLNLGAGLDARPYRLDLPVNLRWIEVDYPAMIQHKAAALHNETPRCKLERVELDLADAQARQQLLARVNADAKRVLVLTEGVIPYLDETAVAALAADLRAQAHFRWWIADYFTPEVAKYRQRAGVAQKMQAAPFRFYPQDWFGFFAQRGWSAQEVRYLPPEGQRLGRPFPAPPMLRFIFTVSRLLGRKPEQSRFGRFAGYVLLEAA